MMNLNNFPEKRVRFPSGPQNPRKASAGRLVRNVAGPVVAMEHTGNNLPE